jgi:hypothetical protein
MSICQGSSTPFLPTRASPNEVNAELLPIHPSLHRKKKSPVLRRMSLSRKCLSWPTIDSEIKR